MDIKYLKHTKGQALLFVVVAMTIALSVGVAVSTRNLSSFSRTSRTDTSVRALAAAEGGIEKLLVKPDDELNNLIGDSINCPGGWTDNGDGSCTIVFENQDDDSIQSQATVKVEYRNLGDGKPDTFTLQPGITKEVILDDGDESYDESDIEICWNNKDTAIYYISYNSEGDMEKGLLISNSCADCDVEGAEDPVSSGDHDYNYCETVDIVDNPYGLRVKALYDDNGSEIAVYPTSGDLPSQGYNLISNGQLVQGGEITVSRLITVYRSYKYLPGFFDYGVYTNYSF